MTVTPGDGQIEARLATTADASAIAELFALPHARGFVHVPTEEQVRSIAQSPDRELWVFERNGAIVGHTMLARGLGWLWEISIIVVREPRRGTGAFAIRHAMHRAFSEGRAHRLFLEVVEQNHAARALYESLGFKVEGRYRDGYRVDEGEYHDLIPYGLLESEYRP